MGVGWMSKSAILEEQCDTLSVEGLGGDCSSKCKEGNRDNSPSLPPRFGVESEGDVRTQNDRGVTLLEKGYSAVGEMEAMMSRWSYSTSWPGGSSKKIAEKKIADCD